MRENYYTAAEAAAKLRLEYHTFMWRVRDRGMYPQHERVGQVYLFDREAIDIAAAEAIAQYEDKKNAAHR